MGILFGLLWSGAGCTDAVNTLGILAHAGPAAPCTDGSTLRSSAGNAECAAISKEAGLFDAASDGDASTTVEAGLGDAAPPGLDACPTSRAPATRRGLNLFLLVDDSLSVVLQPEWGQLTAAITAFVDEGRNAGLGVGVTYYGTSCSSQFYAVPTVPIGVLPGQASAITGSYPLPINGKAITPAMMGAVAYVANEIVASPDRDTVLLLVTDGIIDPLCGSTETSAAQEAGAALGASPSVRTYVIGLDPGPTLINPGDVVDMSPLDSVAVAGGTDQALVVQVNASGNGALTDALDQVVNAASPCTYVVPEGMRAAAASIEWQAASGKARTDWPNVGEPSACGTRPGVFPTGTGLLGLCPASCTALRGSSSSTAWAVQGC